MPAAVEQHDAQSRHGEFFCYHAAASPGADNDGIKLLDAHEGCVTLPGATRAELGLCLIQ